MANRGSSSTRSSGAFDQMKYEVANELGVTLNQDYNGDLSSRDAGRIGGTIVKKVFAEFRNKNQQQ
ncbi:MAG: alpha/beta-type small acid-soluble spore protein [Caldicoprobacterales bacterium]|nr:alpha/beta-type small acid-soluble spore protein [Clostridiales bacterium]